MPRDPSFTIIYGDLKTGKSADALSCFPGAVYVAAPGALSPAESLWGFSQPQAYDLGTFREIREFAEKLPPGHPALVVDDGSLVADRTVAALQDMGITGYDLWGAVFASAIRLRDSLRRRGLHVVLTCHLLGAHVKEGVRHRGGPAFPGQVAAKLPAAADLLLRTEARAGAGGAGVDLFSDSSKKSADWGWPFVYRTAANHPDWRQGSRYSTPDYPPVNLREILNLAGFSIPRLRGLEWQDAIAETLAAKLAEPGVLADGEKARDARLRARDYAMKKFGATKATAYWAVRDGWDRALLRIAAAARWQV